MIGWIAGVSFSLCAVPLVWDSIVDGTNNMNLIFLSLWFVGECGMLYDTWKFHHWPSRLNYTFNLLCIIIIGAYRI